MSKPFFSIVIPTYNRPVELKRAVSSVLSQIFSDFEIIVVNNSSNDFKIPFADDRIKIISEKRRGANFARNTGIEKALADFICFLDDDDEYLSNHLTTLHELTVKNNLSVGLYRTFTKTESGGVVEDQPVKLKDKNVTSLEHIYTIMIVMHCVCCHKNILREYKFDPAVPVAQDYNLWTRILSKYPLFESPVITAVYHKSENSISNPNLNALINYVKVYEDLFQMEDGRKQLKAKTRSMRVFHYLYLILNTCLAELSVGQFYKYSLKAIRYNPVYFFQIVRLKIKFLLIKLNIIKL